LIDDDRPKIICSPSTDGDGKPIRGQGIAPNVCHVRGQGSRERNPGIRRVVAEVEEGGRITDESCSGQNTARIRSQRQIRTRTRGKLVFPRLLP
jgi:hypothetical protein